MIDLYKGRIGNNLMPEMWSPKQMLLKRKTERKKIRKDYRRK